MASENQIAANRENAAHSTGPRTESGKDISSRNNFRHGLASGKLLVEGEDPEEYEALLESLIQIHQPANAQESDLVASLAQYRWLSRRAVCLQNVTLTKTWGVDEKAFALYMRYQTNNDRAYNACLRMLLKSREQLAKERIGFESQAEKKALSGVRVKDIEIATEVKTAKITFIKVTTEAVRRKLDLQPTRIPLHELGELRPAA